MTKLERFQEAHAQLNRWKALVSSTAWYELVKVCVLPVGGGEAAAFLAQHLGRAMTQPDGRTVIANAVTALLQQEVDAAAKAAESEAQQVLDTVKQQSRLTT